jgi:hypothetical protein
MWRGAAAISSKPGWKQRSRKGRKGRGGKMNRALWKAMSVAAVVSALAIGVQQASASILIYDNFNRDGVLHGSSVDVGGLTWTSTGSGHNNTTTANGGQEIGGWNAKLAFTPEAGKIYQLTLTAGPTIQNALIWGFANDSGGFGDYNYLSQDVSDMTWARMGAVDGGLYDYGKDIGGSRTTDGTYTLDANTGPGFVNTLDMLLDTTSGLASAQMTLKVNNVTKGTWTSNVTGYNSIVFGRGTGTQDPNGTQISDLTLQVIPEPASLGMLGAAAAALLLRRKFRR